MPAALTDAQQARAREALLDAAEELFYRRGIQSVGMDQIREASGLSLKRIYATFSTKDDLVVEVLRRRDLRWRTALANHIAQFAIPEPSTPEPSVLAVFDWLYEWFGQPDFRGCAWINIHGEFGAASAAVLNEVRRHKKAFHHQISELLPKSQSARAAAIALLAEGAMVNAGIFRDPDCALTARAAAASLLATTTGNETP